MKTSLDKTIWKKMYREEVARFKEVCPSAIITGEIKPSLEAATDRRMMSEIWSMLNNMKGLH